MTPDELADLALNCSEPEHVTRPGNQHPKGFEPGVRFAKDGTGEAVALVGPGQEPCWDDLLRDMGLSPEQIEVTDVQQVRLWDSGDKVMRYVRAHVRRKRRGHEQEDWQQLYDEIAEWAFEPAAPVQGDLALVWLLGDLQIGKPDGGGSKGTLRRFARSLNGVIKRLVQLRQQGRPASRLVIGLLGDLVENCAGHYPMQEYGVDLDMRGQTRALRKALYRAVHDLAQVAPEVVVAAVPGNHGENRKNGKAHTTWHDNWDVAVPESVAELCEARGLDNVSFVIPRDELVVTLDVHGSVLGLAHGHQARTSGNPQAKILKWWDAMAAVRHPIGDADVLATGHYHHWQSVERGAQRGAKTWMQIPALDGGSTWWAHKGGGQCVPGTVSMLMGEQFERGWAEVRLL